MRIPMRAQKGEWRLKFQDACDANAYEAYLRAGLYGKDGKYLEGTCACEMQMWGLDT